MLDLLVSRWRLFRDWVQGTEQHERSREIVGAILARQVAQIGRPRALSEVEFRVHSQFGDDGIIQWLVARLPSLSKLFIEFGVEDYREANTRFLMIHNGWRGLVMDGSPENIARLRRRRWFWRYGLDTQATFVTRDNVDSLITKWAEGREVGLLHIDVDGNDYWLWEALHSIRPGIVIVEYNALFGAERPITIPYAAEFRRYVAHYSGQYAGASLAALTHLAKSKRYALIGVNSAGNNAYFVQRELLNANVREVEVAEAFVEPSFRESRGSDGRLDFRSFVARQALIKGLPVVNVATGNLELV